MFERMHLSARGQAVKYCLWRFNSWALSSLKTAQRTKEIGCQERGCLFLTHIISSITSHVLGTTSPGGSWLAAGLGFSPPPPPQSRPEKNVRGKKCALSRLLVVSGYFLLKNVPHINNRPLAAVESQSIICQIKTRPPSWTTAAAIFFFRLASASLEPIVALASTGFANPAFLLLAVVLVRALRGMQSPAGGNTEISLL
jgi:hypothetical protein